MNIDALLSQVQSGEIDIQQAKEHLKTLPYEDLGFAKLDHHRKLRNTYGEVIYCAGKTVEHTVKIYQSFYERGANVLGTRATPEQAEALKSVLPCAQYDPLSRILQVIQEPVEQKGCVAVCTGGTSDMAVAEEAARTAEFLGAKVERIYDVGVAGIHRLLSKTTELRHANCVIAVAGMEGALGGVVAGLVDKPVIAVPTSVGYGASLHGLSALLTMLNSCAEGITVVNIDNGFGAGYSAAQINRLAISSPCSPHHAG